jgi:hypothetical protein
MLYLCVYLLTVNVDFTLEQFEGAVATFLGLSNPGLAESFQCHILVWILVAVTSIIAMAIIDPGIATPIAIMIRIISCVLFVMLSVFHTITGMIRIIGPNDASKITFSELFGDGKVCRRPRIRLAE